MTSGALRWAGRVVRTKDTKCSLWYEAPHSFPVSGSHNAEPTRKAPRIMNRKHTECGTVNDKPSVAQLVKKFPTSYGALMFKSVSKERGNGPHHQPHKSLSQPTAVLTLHNFNIPPAHTYIFRLTLFRQNFG